jgi:hypothetical protein
MADGGSKGAGERESKGVKGDGKPQVMVLESLLEEIESRVGRWSERPQKVSQTHAQP